MLRSLRILLLLCVPTLAVHAGPEMPEPGTLKRMPDSKDLGAPISDEKSGWEFKVGVPGWLAGVEGDVGIRGVRGEADITFGEVFRHLKGVAALKIEGQKDKWGFQVAGMWLKLRDDLDTRDQLYSSGAVEFSEVGIDFTGSYRLVDQPVMFIDATLGGRFNYLDLQIDLESNRGRLNDFSRSGSEAWCDPVLGFRTGIHLTRALTFNFKGDVGGFGLASHITWQVDGGLELQITRCFYASAGYKYLVTDYTNNGFTWDVAMGGPVIECGIKF